MTNVVDMPSQDGAPEATSGLVLRSVRNWYGDTRALEGMDLQARGRGAPGEVALSYRAGFARATDRSVVASTPGLTTADLASLPWRRRSRPLWPCEDPPAAWRD